MSIITEELLRDAVSRAESLAGVLRILGKKPAGGTQAHYKRRIVELGIDFSHFKGKGWNRDCISSKKKTPGEILILRSSGGRAKPAQLRRALIESGVPYVCSKCNSKPEWRGNPLVLDVDHINENWLDDRKENLRFLCPNCHSQYTRRLINN